MGVPLIQRFLQIQHLNQSKLVVLQTETNELKKQVNLLEQNLIKSEANIAFLKEEIDVYVKSKIGLEVEVTDKVTDEVSCCHRLVFLTRCGVSDGPSSMSLLDQLSLHLSLSIPFLKLFTIEPTPLALVYSSLFWSKHQNPSNRLILDHHNVPNQKLGRENIGRVEKLRLYRRQFKLQIGLVFSDFVLFFSSSLFCWVLYLSGSARDNDQENISALLKYIQPLFFLILYNGPWQNNRHSIPAWIPVYLFIFRNCLHWYRHRCLCRYLMNRVDIG